MERDEKKWKGVERGWYILEEAMVRREVEEGWKKQGELGRVGGRWKEAGRDGKRWEEMEIDTKRMKGKLGSERR